MSLSTHVLDTAQGVPAEGVPITLERQGPDGHWVKLAHAITDHDGRVRDFVDQAEIVEGTYQITFHTREYHQKQGVEGFYPYVPVIFVVRDRSQHHHVPLLLSPFGISTYRGS